MSFPRRRESIFSFPSKYYSATTNTSRNYLLKKEGFFESFVVLVSRCKKIEKESSGKMKSDIAKLDPLICP